VEKQPLEEAKDDVPVKVQKSCLNCLIANYEPIQLMILAVLMKQNGYNVITAQNGYEAFQRVQETMCDPE